MVDRLDYEIKRTYELTIRATDTMTGSFAEIKVQVNLKVNECKGSVHEAEISKITMFNLIE